MLPPEDPPEVAPAAQFETDDPAMAVENAPLIHELAEVAAACDAEGAIEIRAEAKELVSLCKLLISILATEPIPLL